MPLQLALPYTITADESGAVDPDAIQGNFDAIKKLFPLSRKVMKVMTPILVGSGGTAPAFANSWVNFDTTTFMPARFWKDPFDHVHVEGLIKSGTIGATAFVLPEGYRPGNGLLYATISNGALGRVDIGPTGNIVITSGNNAYVSIFLPPFKQEN